MAQEQIQSIQNMIRLLALIIFLIAGIALQIGDARGKTDSTRPVKFPDQFSMGKLYKLTAQNEVVLLASYYAREGSYGKYLGEAQGLKQLPTDRPIYLIASYELLEHAKALQSLPPDLIACLSFGKMGLIQSLDSVLPYIGALSKLQRLELRDSELSEEALSGLKPLKNLESLDLSMSGITGKCFKDLPNLSSLKSLDAGLNKLDPATSKYIAQLKNIQYLDVSHTGATDADIVNYVALKKLRQLNIAMNPVTSKSMALIKTLPQLDGLNILDTNIDVDGLKQLAGCKLKHLTMPKRKYTREELAQVQQVLPGCHLHIEFKPVSKEQMQIFAPLRY